MSQELGPDYIVKEFITKLTNEQQEDQMTG